MARPKVLFIGGTGRSGSTLFLRMLGELKGYFPAGDLTQLWQRGFLDDQLCGCGENFSNCEVWGSIAKNSVPDLDREAITELQAIKERVCHTARIPQVLQPSLRSDEFSDELRRYGDAMGRVYRGIVKESGCSVIVDGSKNPGDAAVLLSSCDVDVYIVHLVRDSRGVAASWLRKKERPEIHWKKEYMSTYGWFTTSMAWNIYNGLFEYFGQRFGNYQRIRYEDLVMRPKEVLAKVIDFVGVDAPLDPFEDGVAGAGRVNLSSNHTVSGNPMRFTVGDIELREDVGWKKELTRAKKAAITTLTLPLLRRYAYRAKP